MQFLVCVSLSLYRMDLYISEWTQLNLVYLRTYFYRKLPIEWLHSQQMIHRTCKMALTRKPVAVCQKRNKQKIQDFVLINCINEALAVVERKILCGPVSEVKRIVVLFSDNNCSIPN